jgi:hypothetical protein
MVERLVRGDIRVPEFEEPFREFLFALPESALSAPEWDLYDTIQENLGWTAESVTQEERGYGWIDHREYAAWAGRALLAFEQGRELPPRA